MFILVIDSIAYFISSEFLLRWLVFLEGFIFLGYGMYIMKRRKGYSHTSPTFDSEFKVREIKGEAASVLGLIYVLLGIFWIGVGLAIRYFIRDF